jgi:hypothetical protein
MSCCTDVMSTLLTKLKSRIIALSVGRLECISTGCGPGSFHGRSPSLGYGLGLVRRVLDDSSSGPGSD